MFATCMSEYATGCVEVYTAARALCWLDGPTPGEPSSWSILEQRDGRIAIERNYPFRAGRVETKAPSKRRRGASDRSEGIEDERARDGKRDVCDPRSREP